VETPFTDERIFLKLTPLVKTPGNRYYQIDWIIQYFPKDQEQLEYVEPYAGGASLLLNKPPSQFEGINDCNAGIIEIYKAIRDEPKIFTGRLKRVKYCEATFIRATKKTEFEDYLDHAINEYILRRMSVAGSKNTFGGSEKTWNKLIEQLPVIAKRLVNVHIFCKDAKQIIQAFNHAGVFVYADPPPLEDTDDSANQHVELADLLANFLGKVLITGPYCTLYRRIYQNWKCVKNSETKDALWVNF